MQTKMTHNALTGTYIMQCVNTVAMKQICFYILKFNTAVYMQTM